MSTEIRTWQIAEGKLAPIVSSLKEEGHTEPYDLEPWLASSPEIIGSDLFIVGRQVQVRSGRIDFIAIDKSGDVIIVELKRDKLARECLAQAIDYASEVASWTLERLSEVCAEYQGKKLEAAFNDAFPDVDLETLSINSAQRIILLGFSVEAALERMIEWLSHTYGVNVNAVVLNYVKTKSGDELLARTSVISEEAEQQRAHKQKKFEIAMSDDPGSYPPTQLKELLSEYLSRDKVTNQRMRTILFPALLRTKLLSRADLKKEFISSDPQGDESKVGYYLTLVSSQLGMKKNDFLRQIVSYEYPRKDWEKDNFALQDQYRLLLTQVLAELKST